MSRSATHQQVHVLLLADGTSGGERLQEHFAFFWGEIMITKWSRYTNRERCLLEPFSAM